MAKLPSSIEFVCEACGFHPKPKCKMLKQGVCKKCSKGTWAILIQYVESETNKASTALGLASLMVFGSGWIQRKSHESGTELNSVSSETIQGLLADPKLVAERVLQFSRLCSQADREAQGAIRCKSCNALFLPSDRKSWHGKGFCSVSCSEDLGEAVSDVELKQPLAQTKPGKVEVSCPCGRSFFVLATFSGCLRPCPRCGQKIEVP